MEKIIVTTDFSANSRAAMRFAIQLAAQRNAQVVFLHVYHVLRASFWSDELYAYYVERQKENALGELMPIIRSIYRSLGKSPFNHEVIAHHNLDVTEGILEYARISKASYICISTRGAGTIRKLFGTHTVALIERSSIPVICIPARQHVHPVHELIYASDMTDYAHELKQVIDFARPMQTNVTLLHLAYNYEFSIDTQLMEDTIQKRFNYPVHVAYCKRDINRTMQEDIEAFIKQMKHAILVLFTEQQGMLNRFLTPGNARKMAFHASQIFISFPKRVAEQQAGNNKNKQPRS